MGPPRPMLGPSGLVVSHPRGGIDPLRRFGCQLRTSLAGVSVGDSKQLYLAGYDYGMGGLWGVMLARSEEEIARIYPELVIVHGRPQWMTDELYARICEHEYDIDGAPWGMLNTVLSD